MKLIEKLILVLLLFQGVPSLAQFTVAASDSDPCNCTGEISFQPTSALSYSYQLFDVSNLPIESAQNQTGNVQITGLCPSVFHMVVTYANGTVVDDYFEVPAGTTSNGEAHRVVLCLEAYTNGSGGTIPYDLTPELTSFVPGGTWYAPNGLVIPNAALGSLTASTMESGWYTYVTNSGGCDATSGVYIQANNTGLTTTYVICETYEPFAMIDFMQGTPDTIGQWFDASLNVIPGGIYDPAVMDDALFTYVIDNLAGCQPVFRSMYVDEQQQRDAGVNTSIMVCEGSGPFNMLNQVDGNPDDGGVWSGPSSISPAGSDTFNPSTMNEGVYTYSISSAAPCSTRTSTLTITYTTDNPSGLSADLELCSTAGNLNMFNALGGNPVAGGTWTSPSGAVVDGTFSPGTEPAGNYGYYYPNVGCSPASSVLSISVEAPVNAGSNGTATICQTDPTFNLNSMLSSNSTSGGAWQQGTNLVSNVYIPVGSGSYNFVYSVDAAVCADDQASFTLFVQPAVAVPLSQTIYLCSLGAAVDLTDYFSGLANVYFENSSGALVSNQFNPASQSSVILEVINPSGNSCPDQEGQLNVQVLQPVIEDAIVPFDVCRSSSTFNLNNTIPPSAVGMGNWLDINNTPVSNFVSIDFTGTESYIYEVIQPITCGGEQVQIDLITYTPNYAGQDGSELFCYTDSPALLTDLLPESAAGAGVWYFNNSPFNANSFDPGINPSGNYVYRIAPNGPCPADEAVMQLYVQMGINYSAGTDVHVCAGSSAQPIGSAPANGALYSWSPTSGLDDPQSPSPVVNIPSAVNQTSITTYSVFADDGVCTFTDYVDVIVEPNPIINLNPSYDICFGESLTFENVVEASSNWTPTNLFDDPNAISPSIQPASSVYIGVESSSEFGCTSNAFSQINVNPLPILITESPSIGGCKPVQLSINPSSESLHIDQIVWNVSGIGTIVADSLNLSLEQPGVYDVEATAISEFNCVSSVFFEEIAEVYPSPVAHFTISPTELTTLEPEAEFENQSVGAAYYQWWFNGLGESIEENPSFTFPNERSDNFYICLDATNNYGCHDTTCRYVYMNAEYVVFAPNAFTPDDDGDNDVWLPVIRGFDTGVYELSIFNRWGDRVFYSTDSNEPWTGNIENGEYYGTNEVYNWRVKLKVDNSADEIYYTGSVVLIR